MLEFHMLHRIAQSSESLSVIDHSDSELCPYSTSDSKSAGLSWLCK